jgi:hypothetical protein
MERRAEEKEAMEREKLLRAEEVLRLEQRTGGPFEPQLGGTLTW